jgi:hypothetical protein
MYPQPEEGSTMKNLSLVGAMTIGLFGITGLQAAEVSLRGQAVCAKCNLDIGEKCTTVLRVTTSGTLKNYYVRGKLAKQIQGKSVTVKGNLQEVEGRMVLNATEVNES